MDITTLNEEKENTLMSVKEYKCKCGEPASFFYLVCSDMSVNVYSAPSYWDNKQSFNDSLHFIFVCSGCLPKDLAVEKLKGNTPDLYVKNEDAKLFQEYRSIHIGLKEYILKHGGE